MLVGALGKSGIWIWSRQHTSHIGREKSGHENYEVHDELTEARMLNVLRNLDLLQVGTIRSSQVKYHREFSIARAQLWNSSSTYSMNFSMSEIKLLTEIKSIIEIKSIMEILSITEMKSIIEIRAVV